MWTYDGKAAVNAKKAAAATKVFTSVTTFNKKFTCTSMDGFVHCGNDMKEEHKLHDKSLDCLAVLAEGTYYYLILFKFYLIFNI